MTHSRSRGKRSQPQHHQQIQKGGGNPVPWREEQGTNYKRSGSRYPGEQSEYEGQRNYSRHGGQREEPDYASNRDYSDEEKGRQFGSSWRSGNTQRESGNRDWVSGVGQTDYRDDQERGFNPAGYQYNEVEFNRPIDGPYRGPRRSMEEGTWGSEGGGGWSSTGSPTRRRSFAGRGPQGYRRSDERITEDINDELTEDDELDASGISVEVKSGEVVLKGFVTDRESKRRAEEIAESCSGVKDVQNQIRIKREDSAEMDQEGRREKSGEKTDDKRSRFAS